MQHSWISILRRLCLGLAMLGVAGGAHAELGDPSDNTAACCQLTTSLVNDVLRGKDVSGDERFFSTDGAPPNIHFLVDASGSMRELPQVTNSEHGTQEPSEANQNLLHRIVSRSIGNSPKIQKQCPSKLIMG